VQTIETGSTVDINQKRQLNTQPEDETRGLPARTDWRGRYSLGLVFIDWIVGLVAAAAALGLRFGGSKTGTFLLA